MYLGLVVGRSIATSAVDHNHTISGIYFHRDGENILDLALKRCLARFSARNPVYQRYARQVQRIVRKPVVQSR